MTYQFFFAKILAFDISFVLTNPFLVKDNYLEDLPPSEKIHFKGSQEGDVVVFSLVVIPPERAGEATVNLLGPLVIDSKTRNGKQIILANSGYDHQHPFRKS